MIFLDLRLPKLSGLEVLREVKSNPGTASIPVVVVTSPGEDPDIQSAYALGMNSYIVKPVEFDAFTEAMSQVGLYWPLVSHPPY